MGYDHETDEGQMDALEGRLRRRLGLAAAPGASDTARVVATRGGRRR
jgi:hypothetical protein